MTGMTDAEVDEMLALVRAERERTAVPLGDGISRSPVQAGCHVTALDARWTVDVWDDQYATTLVVDSQDPADDTIRALFLWRKGSSHT